ncbi:GntR family transcriptional regulator [Paracraurococcus lichenis]|uniref:GntR family transcriptional regulator n=1 Tax=Paracraurococcus lichenis TaxID=3064888 RepID=A0ABT9E8X9_9PROT|nr:GntR family transcriptional regulator [Paracraurococcus sp. LOR1-02]MDO9712656.1 GntR family transcriptional regulator [Paracraurococcus sp. LOR1-02]
MNMARMPADSPASASRVYERIKFMAMAYQFRPGERINELALAEQLGVSRTPLREALNRLVSESFVTVVPGRGFFGRLLDAKEIHNLYEVRASLEEAIIRLACERASDEELEALETFARSRPTQDNGKSLEALRHDEEFHLRIARMTHNAEFVRLLEGINSRIHFVRWIDMRRHEKLDMAAHIRFAQLLRKRDIAACLTDSSLVIRRRYNEIVDVIRTGIAEIYMTSEHGA